MKISYAITAYNELNELKHLIPFLLKHKRKEDEIVVLWDNNGPLKVLHYLQTLEPEVIVCANKFDHHFADWKNRLASLCNGDYIFQIDADEWPTIDLVNSLPLIVEQGIDIILVPRNNTVKGLTEEHIKRWGWNIDEYQRINWPDYQWRIYKKCPEIKWKNKVHEVLEGYKTYTTLPHDMSFGNLYLHHHKNIEKQEKQNNYYDTL